jgi:hypothetical protein
MPTCGCMCGCIYTREDRGRKTSAHMIAVSLFLISWCMARMVIGLKRYIVRDQLCFFESHRFLTWRFYVLEDSSSFLARTYDERDWFLVWRKVLWNGSTCENDAMFSGVGIGIRPITHRGSICSFEELSTKDAHLGRILCFLVTLRVQREWIS